MSKPTVNEAIKSLTGYDEIAIRKHFPGIKIYSADEEGGVEMIRALVMVDRLRAGDKAGAAVDHAMKQTIGDLEDYFATEPVEEDGTETFPITESGKDSETPAA